MLHNSTMDETQGQSFIVNLDSYEGPLDVLLSLARNHEVDLREISLVVLAEQYMSFLRQQDISRLTKAADYLVMAAWLTWLKARLLTPQHHEQEDDEEDPFAKAEQLREQLIHLNLIRQSVSWLKERPQLGQDFFARPAQYHETKELSPPPIKLYQLLEAYSNMNERDEGQQEASPSFRHHPFMSVAVASTQVQKWVRQPTDFIDLVREVAQRLNQPMTYILIPMFMASLQLMKSQQIMLSQKTMDDSLTIGMMSS